MSQGRGPSRQKGWTSGNCYAKGASPHPQHPPPIKACNGANVCVSWTPPDASAAQIAAAIKDADVALVFGAARRGDD